MNNIWYDTVEASERLTQGDLILDCPLVNWSAEPLQLENTDNIVEVLGGAIDAISVDVVVMTQACDLEHEKVRNVVLCPLLPLSDYRSSWEGTMREKNQNPTARAWRGHCDDITDGFVWNLAILNANPHIDPPIEHLIVDFSEIYTAPREFLESLLAFRGTPRQRLLPPYREHLSQAFARFFMRVGLPVLVEKVW
jgi:hypothetical protein